MVAARHRRSSKRDLSTNGSCLRNRHRDNGRFTLADQARLGSFLEVSRSLMRPGRVGVEPPGFHYVGLVRKFFDRPQVASVVLDPSATVHRGDFILIRLADRYYGQEIESMQKDRADIDEARGGVVGIQTALRRSDVGVGDFVFVRAGRGAG
jgi:hypothetical protein